MWKLCEIYGNGVGLLYAFILVHTCFEFYENQIMVPVRREPTQLLAFQTRGYIIIQKSITWNVDAI